MANNSSLKREDVKLPEAVMAYITGHADKNGYMDFHTLSIRVAWGVENATPTGPNSVRFLSGGFGDVPRIFSSLLVSRPMLGNPHSVTASGFEFQLSECTGKMAQVAAQYNWLAIGKLPQE